jgi:tetratricopeptide (TPR) repeat protein
VFDEREDRMTVNRGRKTALGVLAVLILLAGGCSGGGFFSTTFQDITGYFNTYYNAKKTFEEALAEVQRGKPVGLDIDVVAFHPVSQTARSKFQSVIEKCSKIIQLYPQSSLVDDALLMIGHSYFRMKEILPAQRKYAELLENYPSSDLRFEASLGLAKTQYADGKYGETLTGVRTLVEDALAEGETDIAIEALLLGGQAHFDRQEYNEAIAFFNQAVEISGNKRLRAIAAYRLGQCHELRGESHVAAGYYLRALDDDTNFMLEFHSRLRSGIMLAKAEKYDEGMDIFDDLLSERLAPELRSLVEFEKANLYRMREDYPAALATYSLVDSTYRQSDVAAKSHFEKGRIYEMHFNDLIRARMSYDKAKSEYPQSTVTQEAARKAEILGRYSTHRSELTRLDSLLDVALHPKRYQATIDTLDSMRDTTGIAEGDSVEAARRDTVAVPTLAMPVDSIHANRAFHQFGLGVLFFVDMDLPDSSIHWLNTLLLEYPRSRYSPQALFVLAEAQRNQNNLAVVDSLHAVLISTYPESDYARQVRRHNLEEPRSTSADSLGVMYGNAIELLDRGNSQTAVQQLKRLASRHPGTEAGRKARYAIGWIYENVLVNKDSALSQYRKLLVDAPHSPYAQRVRARVAAVDANDDPSAQPPPEPENPPQNGRSEQKPPEKPNEGKARGRFESKKVGNE